MDLSLKDEMIQKTAEKEAKTLQFTYADACDLVPGEIIFIPDMLANNELKALISFMDKEPEYMAKHIINDENCGRIALLFIGKFGWMVTNEIGGGLRLMKVGQGWKKRNLMFPKKVITSNKVIRPQEGK